jgi:4-amino-4-deoxy-L-arabinose transferase-like glycosyltransferase
LKRYLPYLFVALACVAPLFGLGARDLWSPDEADHAAAARELLVEGRWAVPTIAGDTYAEKPPLQLWLIIASAKLRGTDVDPWDARVPSVLGNVLLIAAAWILGKRTGGPWHGSLAALLVAVTSEAFLRARWCQVDELFAGFLSCAMVVSLGLTAKPTIVKAAAAGVFLGLAIMTKGPLGPALLFAALALDAVLEWRHGNLWFRRTWPFLLLVFGLAAAIALPWYVALASQDREGFWRALFHENVRRFLSSQDHRNPPWYYGAMLWSSLAPAAWLLPPALAFAWTTAARPGAKGAGPEGTIHTRDGRSLRFACAAFVAGLLLLSIASSKQGKYLLPLAPFAAVIVADFARHVVSNGAAWQRIWITVVLSGAALVFVIAALFALAASWFGARADEALASLVASVGGPEEVVIPVSAVLWPSLVTGFGAFALLAAGSGSRGSLRLTWLAATLCIAGILGFGPITRAMNEVKSPRHSVEAAMDRLDALRRAGDKPRYAVYFPDRREDRPVESWTGTAPFVYYASPEWRRPEIFRGVAGLTAGLETNNSPVVIVMRREYYNRLPPELRARLSPRFQKDTGSRTLVVLDSAPL